MANAYESSSGTKLYYGEVGADPATALANIQSIGKLPAHEVDEFETTRIDQVDGSAHDWFKQFAPDHIDPGTLEFKLALDGTQLETLYTLPRLLKAFKVLFPSGNKLVFSGFIKSLGPEFQDKSETLVNVVVRASGKPVFTKYTAG